MKKMTFYTFLFAFLFVFVSCNDDNTTDLPRTNVKGKPSTLSFYDKLDGGRESSSSYLYEGDVIRRIVNGTSYSNFEYKDGVLSAINSGESDPNIMDGHGYTKFEQEKNKIIIEAWGEPSSRVYRSEIILENNVPTRLVELGTFVRDSVGKFVKEADGYYYSDFIYDSSGKKLMKQFVSEKSDSTLVYQINYEYDTNLGLFSKVNLPIWYIAYQTFFSRDNVMLSFNRYLNNINNLLSKEVVDKRLNTNTKVNHTLKYDTDNYPISISSDIADEGDYMTIEY